MFEAPLLLNSTVPLYRSASTVGEAFGDDDAAMQDGRHHGACASSSPGSWVQEAACGGQRHLEPLFFIERGASSAPAKAICGRCPVRFECLEFELDTAQPFGIWGGLTERGRRRILRARRRAAAA